MNKYRLRAKVSDHYQNGVRYTEGQIVESPHDLNALFPGKFKVIRGPGKASAEETEPEVRRPAAETVGTRLRVKEEAPADEDSDLAESAPEDSEDEDEGPPRSTKKKKTGKH